ncbi:hypothetical protein FRC11_011112, partial [Ceratobasidium sp. 423]
GELYDGTKVAIRSLRIFESPGEDEQTTVLKDAAKELYHWSKLRHRNVLSLMGLAKYRGQMSMVSEWMSNGDLSRYLIHHPEADRLALANVMVSLEGVAMVADFGNARLKELTVRFTSTAALTFSLRWTAPELLMNEGGKPSIHSDIYAFGMTALETLTGEVPFKDLNDAQLTFRILGGLAKPTRPANGVSDDVWGALESCWAREPETRPSLTTVMQSLSDRTLIPRRHAGQDSLDDTGGISNSDASRHQPEKTFMRRRKRSSPIHDDPVIEEISDEDLEPRSVVVPRLETTLTAQDLRCLLEDKLGKGVVGDVNVQVGFDEQSRRRKKIGYVELRIADLVDKAMDPEGIKTIMLRTLPLDRNVESNSLPFILESYAIWVGKMIFEPLRVARVGREYVFRKYALGETARLRLMLISHFARAIAESTDYDIDNLPSLLQFQDHMSQSYLVADSNRKTSRELDLQTAASAFDYSYELISASCKIFPLSVVLAIMQAGAPIFRRACPDPPETLVHLPSILLNVDVSLRYYATMDVILSVITNRPMFFRYNVTFTPEVNESMMHIENNLGLQWLYGVPDRLVVTLARMNALREDFGLRMEERCIQELEAEITSFRVDLGMLGDPAFTVARMIVQESWRQAAYTYLYMVM